MNRLILLSGGLDSTTCAAMAVEKLQADEKILFLSVSYGQRHKAELMSAQKVFDHYDEMLATDVNRVGMRVVELPEKIFKGPNAGFLINHGETVPHKSYAEIEGVSPSFVPFRNGNLLSIAAAIAFNEDCGEVWAGMHAEDAENWAYPDCTPEFLGAMANAIFVGSYQKVRLVTPLMWLRKYEIVEYGMQLEAPYRLTRSCYAETDLSCGKCPTCISRLDGFAIAGYKDPIEYAIPDMRSEGKEDV